MRFPIRYRAFSGSLPFIKNVHGFCILLKILFVTLFLINLKSWFLWLILGFKGWEFKWEHLKKCITNRVASSDTQCYQIPPPYFSVFLAKILVYQCIFQTKGDMMLIFCSMTPFSNLLSSFKPFEDNSNDWFPPILAPGVPKWPRKWAKWVK